MIRAEPVNSSSPVFSRTTPTGTGRPTGWELPIVVDVDNDGHAEIIVIQNGLGMDKGIKVLGNIDNDWVATRRIWHQFDYHITNIRENGTVPRFEVPNWTVYNNFLANEPFCQ